MFSQFFGSFLLNKNAVTPQQLTAAIAENQQHTPETGDEPEYLLLGRQLTKMGALSEDALADLIEEYNREDVLVRPDDDEELALEKRIGHLFQDAGQDLNDHDLIYITLFLNTLSESVGEDFTPMPPIGREAFHSSYCITQKITGPSTITSRLDMTEDVAMAFAGRYAEMSFEAFDEYVSASMEDLLNLQNGLYAVNLSNSYGVEMTLEPPFHEEAPETAFPAETEPMILPIMFPFGTMHLILTV